jgi:hypothetical protein
MLERTSLLAVAGMLLATAASATTEDNFQLQTTADLLVVCSTPVDDPLYVAAIHFCHGFIVGVHHYHDAARLGPEPRPALFCPPDPAPSRDDIVAGWVEWSRTSPADDGDLAVESVLRYLATTHPCQS